VPNISANFDAAFLKITVFDPEPHNLADAHPGQGNQLGDHPRRLQESGDDGNHLVGTWNET